MLSDAMLIRFITESNSIEGINREPYETEVGAFRCFLKSKATLMDLNAIQEVFAPGKPLRSTRGMDVRIAKHVPMPGGPAVTAELALILDKVSSSNNPWDIHCQFEYLHPYMDGNGRTGRALWAWHMQKLGRRPFDLSFLHWFYYQTLENYQNKRNG